MRKKCKLILALAGVSCLIGASHGALAANSPSSCTQIFLSGERPTVDPYLSNMGQQEVCYNSYDNLYNFNLKVPVYSAEHLTADGVRAARGQDRSDIDFYPEPSIPEEYRSELGDYRSSGMDRGHMANWADNADPSSFSLANIVPQNRDNNRHLWEGIEARVRDLTLADGEVYVVSGPIFLQPITRLHKRIAIPAYLYKAIYDPKSNAASVYLVKNTDGDKWTETTVSILKQMTGIDVFPSLPETVKSRLVGLPLPRVHGHPDNVSTIQVVNAQPMIAPHEDRHHETFERSALDGISRRLAETLRQ